MIKAGSEFEYYLLRDTYDDVHRKGYALPERFGYYNEDYVLLQATKGEPIHRLLRNQMTEARIPIEFSKGEAAPGQHEVNIRYDEVLESADRSVIFKHGAKEIAYLNGLGLTFMAKPDHSWTGSSGHLHMSVWDAEGKHSADVRRARRQPYGMSQTMHWFMGGMMAAGPRAGRLLRAKRELVQALRRRLMGAGQRGLGARQPHDRLPGRRPRPGPPRRVPLPGRRHERLPDLRRDSWGPACGASTTRSSHLPSTRATGTWRRAATACRAPSTRPSTNSRSSAAAREIFGADVVEHYLNAARVEQAAYDAVVGAWERERYLERV